MPGLSGLGFVSELRARGRQVPTIMITAAVDPTLKRRAAELGIKHVLHKPPLAGALLRAVREEISSIGLHRDRRRIDTDQFGRDQNELCCYARNGRIPHNPIRPSTTPASPGRGFYIPRGLRQINVSLHAVIKFHMLSTRKRDGESDGRRTC